jgi:sulfur-carrier protein
MSTVRIPPVLRPVVDGARELPASGGTVAAVLDDLFTSQPALAERLRPDGSLSSFVNVYVNGDDIRHRQGLDTPVETTDVVILLPAMAGGAEAPSPMRWTDWHLLGARSSADHCTLELSLRMRRGTDCR